MKKFSPREILYPTVILLVIGVVSTFLLGWTNNLTEDKIAAIEAEAKAKAMQEVMPQAVSFSEAVQANENMEYTEALDANGGRIGYAFTVKESGYGGEIRVMTGISLDGTIAKVVVIAADNETPGLGQNVKKDNFLNRFIGKHGSLSVVKNAPSSENEIQAVTSATISSTAVTRAVNAATAYFAENLQEGGASNG